MDFEIFMKCFKYSLTARKLLLPIPKVELSADSNVKQKLLPQTALHGAVALLIFLSALIREL